MITFFNNVVYYKYFSSIKTEQILQFGCISVHKKKTEWMDDWIHSITILPITEGTKGNYCCFVALKSYYAVTVLGSLTR